VEQTVKAKVKEVSNVPSDAPQERSPEALKGERD
jgi:hypothetical protein